MKALLKALITGILVRKACHHLKRNNTQVIAITGSMGKTTTKKATYTILKDHFDVACSDTGFNTPIGMSLAILGEKESGFSSARSWLKIMYRVLTKKLKAHEKMILEMGADSPGDIKKLTQIAHPNIAIVTAVAQVHTGKGQFSNVEAIAKEKAMLIRPLTENEIAILNADDERVLAMTTKGKKFTYGLNAQADLKVSDVEMTAKHISFTVTHEENSGHFKVPVLGDFHIYMLMPAIATAIKLGLSLKQCAAALEKFTPPVGRMNPIEGVNKSQIIDSSYNANPTTMEAALNLLHVLNADRKIAALGTMNELGDANKEAHLKIGRLAAKTADMLITVGPEASTLKQGALEAGMNENSIYSFFDSQEAGEFLKSKLTAKDLILAKGSQNRVRMEKLVEKIMEHPDKASELLCRQGKHWD